MPDILIGGAIGIGIGMALGILGMSLAVEAFNRRSQK